jgi:hypothetical protein
VHWRQSVKIVNVLNSMDFKYGDLIIKCHQCGEVQVVEELVTEGRCLYLFNKDDSYIKLHCPKCDITMEMSIVPNEATNAEAEDVIEDATIEDTNEELQEASIPEETV